MNIKSKLITASIVLACAAQASAVTVPFNESFPTDANGWLDGSSNPATWEDVGGEQYISSLAEIPGPGGFGSIVFRGNAADDASGDAFVGDWLSNGVGTFSLAVLHDAPSDLQFFARLNRGQGQAASSIFVDVPPNTWTTITLPVVDDASTWQSFGAGTFNGVFTGISDVQLALSSTQNPSLVGQSYTIGLDNVAIANVPEPATVGLLFLGGSALLLGGLRQLRSRRS